MIMEGLFFINSPLKRNLWVHVLIRSKVPIVILLLFRGEHGGLVVESLTPEREVRVYYLPPPCCVLEQRHIYSPKSTGNTKEAVAPSRHD